jgi:hypothetical protein
LMLEGMKGLHVIGRVLSDKASYIKIVRSVIKHVDSSKHKRLFNVRFLAFYYAPHLDLQDCVELLDYAILHTGTIGPFAKLPALNDVSSEQLYALMQLCLQDRRPRSPGSSPYRDFHERDSCSSCGHKWNTVPSSCQSDVPTLAQLPAAAELSTQQVASLIEMCIRRAEGPKRRVLLALLTLPAAQHFDPDIAQELLSVASERACDDAVHMLCEHLLACAAALEQLDPQLLLQRMEVLLHTGHHSYYRSYDRSCHVRGFLEHPSLQQQARQILPQLVLSAIAEHCSSSSSNSQVAAVTTEDELKMLLQLPAAGTLSTALLQKLMHHSIAQMDGALLPLLVRLPAAAQLQQEDVAVLLQAALGRPCGGSRDSSSHDMTAMHAGSAAIGETAARSELEGQQGMLPQHQEGLVDSCIQQQQQSQSHGRQQQHQQQQQASQAQGVPATGTSIHELLQECLQSLTAVTHMFQLLTVPWVRQLPAAALKGLLVAAGEWQCKALFHWLLQQPQAPRDDAEVQEFANLLRFSAGTRKADPCCYSPEAWTAVSCWRHDYESHGGSLPETYDELGDPVKGKRAQCGDPLSPTRRNLMGDRDYDSYDQNDDRSRSVSGDGGADADAGMDGYVEVDEGPDPDDGVGGSVEGAESADPDRVESLLDEEEGLDYEAFDDGAQALMAAGLQPQGEAVGNVLEEELLIYEEELEGMY